MELKVRDGKGNISTLLQNNQISDNNGSSQNGITSKLRPKTKSIGCFYTVYELRLDELCQQNLSAFFSSSVRFSSTKTGSRRIITLNTQFIENAE